MHGVQGVQCNVANCRFAQWRQVISFVSAFVYVCMLACWVYLCALCSCVSQLKVVAAFVAIKRANFCRCLKT